MSKICSSGRVCGSVSLMLRLQTPLHSYAPFKRPSYIAHKRLCTVVTDPKTSVWPQPKLKMASNITLYWGSGSPPCWRIQMVLEEKGLSGYNSKLVSFEKKEHKSEEILALNPRGQVPTTKIGDIVICESMATCDFLVDLYKGQGTTLVPDDPKQKAVVLQRKYETLVLYKKLYDDLLLFLRMSRPEEKTEEQLTKRKQSLLDELALWEGYLAQTGSFVAGSDFSLADIMVFPSFAFLFRSSAPIEKKFPHITSYYQRMKDRPSVKASWPPHWKDTPNMETLKDLC